MKIEIHVLQNFAPSNLNRDDTGAPKDCEFGGYRRARVSSQCQKRAARGAFRLQGLLAEDQLGARTKRLAHQVIEDLVETHGVAPEEAETLALGAIEGVGLGRNKKGSGEDLWKTEYLLFVPRRIVSALAKLLHANRETLAGLSTPPPSMSAQPTEPATGEAKTRPVRKESRKASKQAASAAYPKEIGDEIARLLEDARAAADVALFGRMIADRPSWNVDASCQVAHAISTNRVQMDFDFFTAVDDFKPGDAAGSDMMGTVQFNSSCFYRYAVLDVDGLKKNLEVEGTAALAKATAAAFLRAFVSAIPTGKQNSMAAHNFPSYALALVRRGGQPLSLANAFLKPARPRGEERDLVDDSIDKLERYLERVWEAVGQPPELVASWADRDLAPAPKTQPGFEIKRLSLQKFYEAAVSNAFESNE